MITQIANINSGSSNQTINSSVRSLFPFDNVIGSLTPSARIAPTYDPAEDATPDALSVPVLLSGGAKLCQPVTLHDGSTDFGPYDIYDSSLTYVPRRATAFDGVDGKITGYTAPTMSAWTLAVWAKLDAGINSKMLISNDRAGWNDDVLFGVNPESGEGTNNRFGITHQCVTSTVRTKAQDTTDLTLGQWYHLAAVSDGATLKLYVDGTLKATTAKVGTTLNFGGAPVQIGSDPNTNRYWNGSMHDARIYSSALDASQIAAIHAGQQIATLPLSHYKLDEPSGTTRYDSSGNGNHGTASGGVSSVEDATLPAINWANFAGRNSGVPRDESDPTNDVLGAPIANVPTPNTIRTTALLPGGTYTAPGLQACDAQGGLIAITGELLIQVPSAQISPTYDPAADDTPDGLTVPILASNSLYPGTGTVELTDGTTTYGPYAIACPLPTVGFVYKTSTGGDIFRPNGIDQFIRP